MKLYTEKEIEETLESMGCELMVNDFFQISEPIEIPSDEEIEKNIEKLFYGEKKYYFKAGIKWMKEQILNQNK
jgi:hypothetical protein